MPDLLLELFSEEIPARMQNGAARDLERLVVGALSDRGLLFDGARSFAGPRRLTLVVSGLPARQPDVSEERKGPRVGAADKAIEGFLRAAGVTLDQCQKQSDGKGEFYVAVIRRSGRATGEVLAECLPQVFASLPWPKSMRWTEGSVRWVRPLHGILCTFDGEVVPFSFADVTSGGATFGHRFLSSGAIEARHFEDYEKKLATAHVMLDAAERREVVRNDLAQRAFALGLEPVPDEALLDEVTGLVEWPVVHIGTIDHAFMEIPAEILRTSMRTHQKYFSLRDPKTGALANRFGFVANMLAEDGGQKIVEGNERVLRARLADAKFFWEQDQKRRLESRLGELKHIVFHARAGTMLEHAHRIALLAGMLAEILHVDVARACRAALLAKTDLVSGVVGEFPELQGVMGYYYALKDGEDEVVAAAIRDHYKPVGPSDQVPSDSVAAVVALADKIASLASLWRAGEKPTGSKDPFALRRAGLGIIRILLAHGFRLPISLPIIAVEHEAHAHGGRSWAERLDDALGDPGLLGGIARDAVESAKGTLSGPSAGGAALVAPILDFLSERLKVALRDDGVRHDWIEAVFSLGGEDDLVRLVARVRALGAFLGSDDGVNLLSGCRRATNILRIEEKRDGRTYDGEPDPALMAEQAEQNLFTAMATAGELILAELSRERFIEAMTVMARLRQPVDVFFDKVTVNADDPRLRENRLLLLARLRTTLHAVADFSKIEG